MHELILEEKEIPKEEREKFAVDIIYSVKNWLQGHEGIVHGGLTFTMFDSFMVILSAASNNLTGAATKSMNIRYLKPIKVNEEYKMSVWVDKIDGKYIKLSGSIKDFEGKEYAQA